MFKNWLISFKGSGSRAHGSAALDHVMIHRGKATTKGKTGFTAEALRRRSGETLNSKVHGLP
jgi:hypothetical protein